VLTVIDENKNTQLSNFVIHVMKCCALKVTSIENAVNTVRDIIVEDTRYFAAANLNTEP